MKYKNDEIEEIVGQKEELAAREAAKAERLDKTPSVATSGAGTAVPVLSSSLVR